MTDTPDPVEPDEVPDGLFNVAYRAYLAEMDASEDHEAAVRAAIAVTLTPAREMPAESDPELLNPVEKIRYAERLIRRDHHILDDDWLFWGKVADHLNEMATIPERNAMDWPGKWRGFNRAQDIATGYIRMSRAMLGEEKPDA